MMSEEVKKSGLKRFLKEIGRPNLKALLVAFIFMLVVAATTSVLAFLIKPIMNKVFKITNAEEIYLLAFYVIILSSARGIAQYIYTVVLNNIGVKVSNEVMKNLSSKFILQDVKFFQKNNSGGLIAIILKDVDAITNLLTDVLINVIKDSFSFLGLIFIMFIQAPIYAGVVILGMATILIPLRIVRKRIKKYFNKQQDMFKELGNYLEQVFRGIRVVKSYNMEKKEISYVDKVIEELSYFRRKLLKSSNIVSSFTEILGGVSIGLVILYMGYAVEEFKEGELQIGSILSFLVALIMAYQPLKKITSVTAKIQNGITALDRYYSFIDLKTEVQKNNGTKILSAPSIAVSFKNVNFSYKDEETSECKQILKNINFDIAEKSKVALVGNSGAGKSTIINLILRFFEVESGEIQFNKQNIAGLTIKSLRDNISLVSQETILFNDTIYNNIAYGSDNPSKEEVMEAAKASYSVEFISKLENGFDTIVGTSGIDLSGGQKQRISIARAMVKKSPILILDEPTSALDSASEQEIQKAIYNLMENKTTIIVSHRFSLIKNCDTIYVVDGGEIVESGTHEELINKANHYKKLYSKQFEI